MADVNITVYAVFVAGMASFLTPCLFHIIPVYVGYLLGETITKESTGSIDKKKLIVNSIGFVMGISIIFILLGITATAIGRYLRGNIGLFKQISAIVIIFLGLFQIGIIQIRFLYKEVRFAKKMEKVGFFKSVLFGIMFGFGWTPCFSAVLGGVLALAANSNTVWDGAMYLGIYSIGLSIPFLFIAIFVNYIFKWMRILNKYLTWIKLLSGIILVILGGLMFFESNDSHEHEHEHEWIEGRAIEKKEEIKVGVYEGEKAVDVTLRDGYNKKVKLSDFYGKKIFLNFFAIWCGPCQEEMPALNKLWNTYKDKGFVLLTVDYPAGENGGKTAVKKFLADRGYTFNVFFDEYQEVFNTYQVAGVPTTLIIGSNGIIEKRVEGTMTYSNMEKLLENLQ